MPRSTGPIPKRSEERIRRNKPDFPITKVTAIGRVDKPELGIEDPHPLVVDFWESLWDSAQSRYYEPSDWQFAKLTMHTINSYMRPGANKPMSSIMFSAIQSALASLLVTEADRRRARMEIERDSANGGQPLASVSSILRGQLAM